MNSQRLLMFFTILSIFTTTSCVVIATGLNTDNEKYSYHFGYEIGNRLERDDVTIDKDALFKGIKDGLSGKSFPIPEDELALSLANSRKAHQEKVELKKAKLADTNKAKNKRFLARNARRNSILQTQSGLQYEILKNTNGIKPSVTNKVKLNYRAFLLNGEEFDSSYSRNRPSELVVNQLITGWAEGVQLMSEGAKYKFYLPSTLAYGATGLGDKIEPYSLIILEVELLEIVDGNAMKHHHHRNIELSNSEIVPAIKINLEKDIMSGWNLQVETKDFRFAPESVNENSDGDTSTFEGHAHLYVDGKKIARLYSPWFHINGLPPGEHTVKVTLNSNDHGVYVVDGNPIEAMQIISN